MDSVGLWLDEEENVTRVNRRHVRDLLNPFELNEKWFVKKFMK